MSLRLSGFSSFVMAVIVCTLASCGGGGGGGDDGEDGPSASCLEAEDHSDIEWIQEEILSPSCANFVACHRGDAPDANGLNLEPGMAAGNMIDRPAMSDTADGLDIVAPGDPENSYLLVVLGQFGEDDPRIPEDVGTMPYNSPLLCEEKRDAIERWISDL
jgi:hypothetical protein